MNRHHRARAAQRSRLQSNQNRVRVVAREFRQEGAAASLLTFTLVLLLLAVSGAAPGSAEERPANTLTAKEEAAGWVLLFDGAGLNHWRGFKMSTTPAGWSVKDGKIHFAPPSEGERADLITKEQYQNFELVLEWAVSPGGNSGIFFHVTEDHPRTYSTGPEFQILDDDLHPDGKRPVTSAGSNYALDAPSVSAVKPVGEFNEARLRVEGDRVTHWLNGKKIVEYRLWTDGWKAQVAASKFASMPAYGLNKTGHIAIQDHGDEIWFRNLRILSLP